MNLYYNVCIGFACIIGCINACTTAYNTGCKGWDAMKYHNFYSWGHSKSKTHVNVGLILNDYGAMDVWC
jgi:hypothetical protein